MKCVDRNGNEIREGASQAKIVSILYKSMPGRVILKVLTSPQISKIAGRLLDSRVSVCLIPGFIKANEIDLDEYEDQDYLSFNDFFTRKIRPENRKADQDSSVLIAPCDGRLTVYDIEEHGRFEIKGRPYTMTELVRSEQLARHYYGGKLLLFRLTVGDYHRYSYIDSGRKTKNYRLPGVLHTVHPVAAGECPVYKENTREFSLLKTENFGNVLMMQVGAMLVGRIVNCHQAASVHRAEEAGMFQYGGSTVIICLEPGTALIDQDIIRNSAADIETRVLMGERIGAR